jgi:hypothetical protein
MLIVYHAGVYPGPDVRSGMLHLSVLGCNICYIPKQLYTSEYVNRNCIVMLHSCERFEFGLLELYVSLSPYLVICIYVFKSLSADMFQFEILAVFVMICIRSAFCIISYTNRTYLFHDWPRCISSIDRNGIMH